MDEKYPFLTESVPDVEAIAMPAIITTANTAATIPISFLLPVIFFNCSVAPDFSCAGVSYAGVCCTASAASVFVSSAAASSTLPQLRQNLFSSSFCIPHLLHTIMFSPLFFKYFADNYTPFVSFCQDTTQTIYFFAINTYNSAFQEPTSSNRLYDLYRDLINSIFVNFILHLLKK